MNFREVFYNLVMRFKGANLSKHKKLIILVPSFILFLIVMTVFSNKGTQKKSSFQNVSIMTREASKSKKDLNYEFIKLDTIKIPSFTSSQEFQLTENPEKSEPFAINTDKIRPELQPTSQQAPPRTARVTPAAPPVQASSLFPISSVNRNPNMIITNNLSESQGNANGSQSLYTGKQSALIKVMLPNRTPVA
ncbi:MAG: hypothetical protein MUC94_10990, partial [bacterium]|nr:hypothetical protein [bacterium]